jgi:hypothetical protein
MNTRHAVHKDTAARSNLCTNCFDKRIPLVIEVEAVSIKAEVSNSTRNARVSLPPALVPKDCHHEPHSITPEPLFVFGGRETTDPKAATVLELISTRRMLGPRRIELLRTPRQLRQRIKEVRGRRN